MLAAFLQRKTYQHEDSSLGLQQGQSPLQAVHTCSAIYTDEIIHAACRRQEIRIDIFPAYAAIQGDPYMRCNGPRENKGSD